MISDVSIPIILLQYFCLLFTLSVHEASHAAMANQCGDPSARLLGRLTLNPIKHIDPLGTVIFPLMMMMTAGFTIGWAKPVPFNPRNLKNISRDQVFIALAGPGSNLLLALIFTFVLRIMVLTGGFDSPEEVLSSPMAMIPLYMVIINLALMLFNMIPVPPLDGHYLLEFFLPPKGKEMLKQVGPFGILIAFVLGGRLIGPPLTLLFGLLVGYALHGVALFTG